MGVFKEANFIQLAGLTYSKSEILFDYCIQFLLLETLKEIKTKMPYSSK